MRTPTILFLSVLASGCSSLPQLTQTEPPKQTFEPVEVKKTDTYIQRYQYEPPEATQVRVGRYSSADAVNTDHQENLLHVVIDTRIPKSAKTVGEGIDFLLMRSGFSMADTDIQGEHISQLLKKPLPHAHRDVGPVMLKDALMMLVGKAYWMKVDPVHRLIAFDTVQEFK